MFSAIERRLEKLVEGAFNSTLRSGLQPVELGRELMKSIDSHRSVGVRGTLLAPNSFEISVSLSDFDRLIPILPALRRDLTLTAKEHTINEGYGLVGPIVLDIVSSERLREGKISITCSADATVKVEVTPARLTRSGADDFPLLHSEITSIGRMPDCSIVLADSNISRYHAEISHTNEGFVIRDMGSTNGTVVNGRRVAQSVLQDNDQIDLGPYSFRFKLS